MKIFLSLIKKKGLFRENIFPELKNEFFIKFPKNIKCLLVFEMNICTVSSKNYPDAAPKSPMTMGGTKNVQSLKVRAKRN